MTQIEPNAGGVSDDSLGGGDAVALPAFLEPFRVSGGTFRLSWSWSAFLWGPWRYVWVGLHVKAVVIVGVVSQLLWLPFGWLGVGWWVLVLHVVCGLLFRFDYFRLLVRDERVWGLPGLRLFDGSVTARVRNVSALRDAGWLSERASVVLTGELRRVEERERRLDAVRMALSLGVLSPEDFRDAVRDAHR